MRLAFAATGVVWILAASPPVESFPYQDASMHREAAAVQSMRAQPGCARGVGSSDKSAGAVGFGTRVAGFASFREEESSAAIGTSKRDSGHSAASQSVRRALLIGINDYLSQDLPKLRGCVNDVESLAEVLTSRYGFERDRIAILTDRDATRRAILSALERLMREAGPEDDVFVHYSGHGSQVEDFNGDEEDGLDETLVPYDARTGNVPDIIDDEMDRILSRAQTRTVFISLDACHSGTGTRDAMVMTRSVPPDKRTALYRTLAGARTRDVVSVAFARYILMTAAAANQSALDGPIDGRYRGLFSYAMTKDLGSANPGASPREILAGVERELERIKPKLGRLDLPSPQLEGPEERLSRALLPAVGATSSQSPSPGASRPWAPVQSLTSSQILLVHGVATGGAVGSQWAVYPAGEKKFMPGEALALAVVSALRGADSVADVRPAGSTVPQNARAVLVSPARFTARLPVRIAGLQTEVLSQIQAALKQALPILEFAGPSEFARFLIEFSDQKCDVYGAGGLNRIDSISYANRDEMLRKLLLLLSRFASAAELLSLENPSSSIVISVNVPISGGRSERRVGERGVRVTANTLAPEFRILAEGSSRNRENSLQLEVRSNTDCYITVVDVDSEGGLNLLFPNELQRANFYPEGRITAGQRVLLPDSIEGDNLAGFNWDFSPPQGIDTIQVFATSDLQTAEMIRRFVRDARRSSGTDQPGVHAPISMETLRRNLSDLVGTRGVKVTANRPEAAAPTTAAPSSSQPARDWTTASVTVVVRD